MKPEEVIELLKIQREDCTTSVLREDDIDYAIAALEKQVPKKPIKDRKQEIRYTCSYSCPSCGGGFIGTGIADYCYHCGQRMDWSVEEFEKEMLEMLEEEE